VGTNSPSERALLDWHLANLECAAVQCSRCAAGAESLSGRYANAGLLASLSLGQWDQDDPWEVICTPCFA